MADAEKLSQADIDKKIEEIQAALKGATGEKEKQEAVKKAIQKGESYPYICAYCKHIIRVEYERVKIAPMLFTDKSKPYRSPCNNICGHWYVSADYLKSLKPKAS